MKKALLLFLTCTAAYLLKAQPEITTIAAGLNAPIGIELDTDGNLWVAESGTGQTDGSVSIIRPDGSVEKFVEGLPSAMSPEGEVSGPERVQSLGDGMVAVLVGPTPDTLERTILIFAVEDYAPGAPLSREDARSVIYVGKTVLKTLPDSNPYSLVFDGCDMYIADAGANAIVRRIGLTGELRIFAQFPPIPNPLPFGPPFSDAVPTRIVKNPDGGFYVSQLTGFPFVTGASKIWSVDEAGTVAPYDTNYSLVTDLAISPEDGGLLALQFASFDISQTPPFLFNSAMITHTHPDGTRDTLVTGFGPSAGMAVTDDGVIYVTSLFFGTVLKIDNLTGIWDPNAPGKSGAINAWPNPAHDTVNLGFELEKSTALEAEIYDIQGRLLARRSFGQLASGPNTVELELKGIANNQAYQQLVLVRLKGDGVDLQQKVLVR